MKTIVTTIFLLFTLFITGQTTYTYSGIGEWSDEVNWSPSYPGILISEEDKVIISEGSEVTDSRIINNGSLTNLGSLKVGFSSVNNGTITNLGELRISSTFPNNGSMINQETGVIIVTNTFVLTPDGTRYSNLTNEGSIINHGEVSIAYFKNNGSLENTSTFRTTARLFGSNTAHTGDFEIGGSSLLPGDMESPTHTRSTGIGTYIFNNNLTLQNNTRLAIDIQSDTETDLLEVGETITLSGTLDINWVDEDYDPEIGTTYTIITAQNIAGTFTELDLPDIGADKMLIVQYMETDVILEVIERIPFVYTGNGDWKDSSHWSPHYLGTSIGINDEVVVSEGSDVIISEADKFTSTFTMGGLLTIEGTLTATIPIRNYDVGTIINNHILNAEEIQNDGILINNGDFNAPENVDEFISEVVNDGTLENNGRLYTNSLTNNASFENSSMAVAGVLKGINSAHTGDFEITRNFRPGNDDNEIGTYRFGGDVTFSNKTQTRIEIEGFTKENDQIQIQGNATLSGNLFVDLLIGDATVIDLELGTTFPIITANSITGCFDNFYFFSNPIQGEKTLHLRYTETSVLLEVIAITPFIYSGIGVWEDENNWEPFYPGTAIYREDEVIIAEGSEVTADNLKLRGTITNNGSLRVASISNDGVLMDTTNSFVVMEQLSGSSTSHTGNFEISSEFIPKRYNFENDVTFLPSAHTILNFETVNPHPRVLIDGNAAISGTLSIELFKKFNFNIGETLDIITADNITGTFDTVNFPDLGPDQLMVITYSETKVSLEVIERVPFVYTGIGTWQDQGNWSPRYPGLIIHEHDEVLISAGSEIDLITLTINGILTNAGSMELGYNTINNGQIINQNVLDTSSIFGTVFNPSDSYNFTNTGTIINESTGVMNFSHNTIIRDDTTFYSNFTNEGTVRNDGELSIDYFKNSGNLENTNSLTIKNRLLGKNLSHTGDFDLENAELRPGDMEAIEGQESTGIGVYTFSNDLMLRTDSQLAIDIQSTTEMDEVKVMEDAFIAGTLVINFLENYNPVVGTSHTLLTANTITGTFDTVILPEVTAGKVLQLSYTENTIILEIVPDQTLDITDHEVPVSKIKMYPNPATQSITIQGLQFREKVSIYSILGDKLNEQYVGSNDNNIRIDMLSSGQYFIRVGPEVIPFIKN